MLLIANHFTKQDFKLTFISSFFMILFSLAILASGNVFKILNYGNINYKTLVLDKKAFYTLPDEICKENCENKESNTYIDKGDNKDMIELHNIKALSTLGKFYYLQTTDGLRFEIDANYIKSKVPNNN
ncbi:hypothetical protein [Campylobacter blaseri]|uniref:hypothetical protein n=1 Tax=Campylobacter blaseri TaxID=2042961 RepID=UPI0012FFFBF5|nr:hypothetical protein [Campylobacter blaseri]